MNERSVGQELQLPISVSLASVGVPGLFVGWLVFWLVVQLWPFR